MDITLVKQEYVGALGSLTYWRLQNKGRTIQEFLGETEARRAFDILTRLEDQIDPANDGPEVDLIRREMQLARGERLFWSDSVGVLPRPMTAMEVLLYRQEALPS